MPRRCLVKGAYLLIPLATLIATGCAKPEVEFGREASPDKRSQLIVTVAEPVLPHGKHTVTIYVQQADGPMVNLASAKMENDGVPFTDKNIALRWTSNQAALVCLRPTDLADRGVRISMSPQPRAEIRDGC